MISKGRPLTFDPDSVVDAAMKLFWRSGYDGVSVGDICEKTGLSKPSLYHSFGSKEDLFIRCLDFYNDNYAAALIGIMEKHENPAKGIAEVLTAAAKQFQDPKFPLGCLAATGFIEAKGKSEKIDKHLVVVQRNFLRAFEKYFEGHRKPTKVSSQHLAQYIVGQFYALAVFSKTNKGLFDFNSFVNWP